VVKSNEYVLERWPRYRSVNTVRINRDWTWHRAMTVAYRNRQ
jgi:hypothetical protein